MLEFWEFIKKNWEWGETDGFYVEGISIFIPNPKPLAFPGDSIFNDGSALIGLAVLLFSLAYYCKRFRSRRFLKDNGEQT